MAGERYLVLEVTSDQAADMGPNAVYMFDYKGGSFGRDMTCTWTLPDTTSSISRRQGSVAFQSGIWWLRNESSGLAIGINDSQESVAPRGERVLNSGDRLHFENWVIEVSLTNEPRRAVPPAVNESRTPAPAGQNRVPAAPVPDARPFDVGMMGGSAPARPRFDPQPPSPGNALNGWMPLPQTSKGSVPAGQQPGGQPGLHDRWWEDAPPPISEPIAPPAPQPRQPAPVVAEHRTVAKESPSADAGALEDFIRGLGLPEASLTPDAMETLGEIVRVVVGGTVEVLRARTEIKNQFRLAVTEFRAAENNPLKMSVDAEDALQNLFLKTSAAYLKPLEAFEHAFHDIRAHQMALLRATQAAYDEMLGRFDPSRLEERLDRSAKRGALLGLTGGKGRLWEAYCAWYATETADKDDCFRRLFGDAFGQAYEKQLRALTQGRKGRKSRPGAVE